MWVRLKGIKVVRKANGREYWYHRKTMLPLRGTIPERLAAFHEIEERHKAIEPRQTNRGTFADLIARYQRSPEFAQLGDLTKRDYRRHLSKVGQMWGKHAVTTVQSAHVIAMRDNLASTPRKANYRMSVLHLLFNYGRFIDSKTFGERNPIDLKRLKLREGPGYSPWPANVLQHALDNAYPELRWVIIGTLETGQRSQDVVAMTWGQYDGEAVELVQRKTKERLRIRASSLLKNTLSQIPRRHALIFTTRSGKPWNLGHLRHEIADVLLPHKGYGMHGLRFLAAKRLRAVGCEWDEIAAITGHRSMKMARMYAEREERASDAVIKLDSERG